MNILKTYFSRSDLSLEEMRNKVSPNFDQFLSGEKVPSFNQLTKIAHLLDIPVGLLLIDKSVTPQKNNINFRTINSESIANPSSELKDTIFEMKEKQDFLQKEINYDLDYIGKYTANSPYLEVAQYTRNLLNLPIDYYRQSFGSKSKQLGYLRKKINKIGVFIFFNGKIKDNTSRRLNIDEFRGFVLVDKKAPIIFINQKDTKNGQIFTLIHEFIHLLIGDEEILGTQSSSANFDKTEAFVNKVTSEILVPDSEFKKQCVTIENIDNLAKYFKISRYVIVRRMRDDKYISSDDYNRLVKKFDKEFQEYQKSNKTRPGGNYRQNINFRIDKTFFNYVENAVNTRQITYTDAFNIIGVGYKGYQQLKEG